MNNTSTSALLSATLVISAIALPMSASAEWSGGIEGGQVIQGDQQGTRLRFSLSNNERPLTHRFFADWVRGDSNTNSYEAGYEPQYWFSDTTYVFGEASLRTAEAEQIDQQIDLLAGLGIELINTQTTQFYAEVGAGQKTINFDDTFLGAESTVDTIFTVARASANQIFLELIKLELDADFAASEDIETITAEAGVSYRISGGAIKYSYRVRSNSVGDQDAINVTDSTVSFNYNF